MKRRGEKQREAEVLGIRAEEEFEKQTWCHFLPITPDVRGTVGVWSPLSKVYCLSYTLVYRFKGKVMPGLYGFLINNLAR